ncbi:MAG: 1,4-dihydroxy-2-naphthoate polyprenyltransferase [Acidimicrobiia bacterium]|nr:1,4-dihydroxy-2-naphthoate polyprenyltransferase [Acidimicrobiia bacterium]
MLVGPPSRPNGLALWWAGARPRTLGAALVPVAVGTATAVGNSNAMQWWRAALALLVALALQVGVNFANDYADGVRGTDGAERTGPLRLVGSGLVSPVLVKRAALASFAVAGVAGLVLAVDMGPELLLLGALCLVAGWTYTGGPKPYGYHGLGELFVFLFFGLVATVGSNYVITESLDPLAVAASIVVGIWATALLVVNNLRDLDGDAAVGKITLAVRLGDARTRRMFIALQVIAMLVAVSITLVTSRLAIFALLGLPLIVQTIRSLHRGAKGAELIAVLVTTAQLQLVSGLAMAGGIALSVEPFWSP